ncbi:MAG: hypothetical protein J6X26_02380, partial [Bacteroidales bacterium]|nr:hypothetical protein [Bacteroidales bacterium]
EFLITLVIIGVIAAMTIPSLLNSKDQQQWKTGCKKAFSTLETIFSVNEVSGEYDFDGILAVGLKLSCTLGEVDKITINSSGNVIDESQNLSSLMFTLFISFHTK